MFLKTLIHTKQCNVYITLYNLISFYQVITQLYYFSDIKNVYIRIVQKTKDLNFSYYKIFLILFIIYFHLNQKFISFNKKNIKFNILKSSFVYKKAQLHYQIENYNISFYLKLKYNILYLAFLQKKLKYFVINSYSKKIYGILQNIYI